jgi:5-methylcytosine-specific restriction endonuclease McrA
MSCLPKIRPVRLDSTQYAELHRVILRRDSWRCQVCGTMLHLEVHHQQFRSHSGEDLEENLITLCHSCHSAEHSLEKSMDG